MDWAKFAKQLVSGLTHTSGDSTEGTSKGAWAWPDREERGRRGEVMN
jgi:hypothetical protein